MTANMCGYSRATGQARAGSLGHRAITEGRLSCMALKTFRHSSNPESAGRINSPTRRPADLPCVLRRSFRPLSFVVFAVGQQALPFGLHAPTPVGDSVNDLCWCWVMRSPRSPCLKLMIRDGCRPLIPLTRYFPPIQLAKSGYRKVHPDLKSDSGEFTGYAKCVRSSLDYYRSRLLHHGQIFRPGPYLLFVPFGHGAADLHDVGEVMRRPGCEKLAHGHSPQGGVGALELELPGLKIEPPQTFEIGGAQSFEVIKHLVQRLAVRLVKLRLTVKRVESPIRTEFEDDGEALHPVRTLGMVQMSEDVVRAPCIRSFGGVDPGIREAAKESIEHCRSARQYGHRLFQKRCGHKIHVNRQ